MGEPKVTLLSHTELPLETVYSVWEASKGEGRLRSPAEIAESVPKSELVELFRAVIAQHIPVGEHVDLVFMLENVSVSWREQAVRHRIGASPSPERLGSDIVVDRIPDLANSSWWSQSMRIQNMGKFASNFQYRLPSTVLEQGGRVLDEFKNVMRKIEDTYNYLVESGIPMEDAREVIPLGAQSRISWRLNIGSLGHIVGKRSCWILQGGIWAPIIEGMINEAAEKIHPVFRALVTPPCMDGDSFNGCIYKEECRRRLVGDDELPPCPIHLHYHDRFSKEKDIPLYKEMKERAVKYERFWGRDPFTGKRNK